MPAKILTKHPQGKQGVRIDMDKYDTIKGAIERELKAAGELTFQDLTAKVDQRLKGKFDGSVGWYVTTVKLDLEARKKIERVGSKSPQVLRLR
ncbi:hypothetical protein GF377_05000 [candidate division GN15 bacterium]|nr:hypothetical protein [candidate division GN15 bacterium]